MRPLTIPKLTRPIDLAGYAPEIKNDDGTPALVHAWVNPPEPVLARHGDLSRRQAAAAQAIRDAKPDDGEAMAALRADLEALGRDLCALFAELWSQHADPATHWSADDVAALAATETDPALFPWLTGRTIALINDHRAVLRKN